MTVLLLAMLLQDAAAATAPVVVTTPPSVTIVQSLPWPQILQTLIVLGGMFITAFFSFLTKKKTDKIDVKTDAIQANTGGDIEAIRTQREEMRKVIKGLMQEALNPAAPSPIAQAVSQSLTQPTPANPEGPIQQQVKRALNPPPPPRSTLTGLGDAQKEALAPAPPKKEP